MLKVMTKQREITSTHQKQSGLALPMTLILLLVMTLLGVSSLRLTTQDEEMVSNNRLREIAFNAAESTLVFAEEDIISNITSNDLREKLFINDDYPGDVGTAENGDSCPAGYCTPAKFDNASATTTPQERWIDPSLNVWNDSSKHLTYGNYSSSNLADEGVYSAPKYIVEFMGNVYDNGDTSTSSCWNPSPSPETWYAPNDAIWPYCKTDKALVRITATASAGSAEKSSTVMLQSTIILDN